MKRLLIALTLILATSRLASAQTLPTHLDPAAERTAAYLTALYKGDQGKLDLVSPRSSPRRIAAVINKNMNRSNSVIDEEFQEHLSGAYSLALGGDATDTLAAGTNDTFTYYSLGLYGNKPLRLPRTHENNLIIPTVPSTDLSTSIMYDSLFNVLIRWSPTKNRWVPLTRVTNRAGEQWIRAYGTDDSSFHGADDNANDGIIYHSPTATGHKFHGPIAADALLNVVGATTLQSTLDVTGNTTVTTITASGAASLLSTLNVTGAATLQSTLEVTGATTVSTVTATAAAALQSTLDVTGNTTVTTISSSGMATLNTLSVTAGAAIGTTLGVTGATTLTTLTTTGLATLATLDVTGDTTVTTITASGAATLQSTLNVTAAATLQSTLGVTGATTVTDLTATGTTTLTGATISGTTASADITASGTLNVTGIATLNATTTTTLDASGLITAAVDPTGAIGVGTGVGSKAFNDDSYPNFVASAPAATNSVGAKGDYYVDVNFLYFCTDTDTWRRTAVTTW